MPGPRPSEASGSALGIRDGGLGLGIRDEGSGFKD